MNMKKSASDIFRLEHEVVTKCSISKERFHKVNGNQWEDIYQKIAGKVIAPREDWKVWQN